VLNSVTARLLALLEGGQCAGREALLQVADELKHPQPDVVVQGGRQILEDLRQQQAVLGTWR
jgi:hypothetical protein